MSEKLRGYLEGLGRIEVKEWQVSEIYLSAYLPRTRIKLIFFKNISQKYSDLFPLMTLG